MSVTTRFLQNQKYQSCIDACNACAESCEFCATECLREEDVKMLSRCIQLCRDAANICWTASRSMSADSDYIKMCARYVPMSVMHAQKNVASMLAIWNIVDCVLKLVQHVRLNAEKWLNNVLICKVAEIGYIPLILLFFL